MVFATPTLQHVADMQLFPGPPLDAGETPRGKANWIEVTGGSITTPEGKHIATVQSGGGDYCTRHVDGQILEVDLQVIAKDESGTLFRFQSVGFDYLDKPTMMALDGKMPDTSAPPPNAKTPPELGGMEVIFCNTSSSQFRWMNFSILIGKVQLILGPTGVERVDYTIFRVLK
ncbi:hypothetical protein F5884DRAFT_752960 [Xylogone sp. PMI_703]|nr:hypothetical protein F5884DRAFT_752960 [Xylogone sp. PMI_703]